MRTELLRFNGAVERDPAIDAWMKEHAGELGAIAHQWFEVMRKCGDEVRELLHDGCPVACLGDAPFGYVNVFTSHVNVGFFHGAALPDPARLLQGTGKFMRHVKLRPETSFSWARPPYRCQDTRPVLAALAQRWHDGDILYVYYGAREAMDFYGKRAGFKEWTAGECHREEPRAYFREVDQLRGHPRVWFFYTHSAVGYREPEGIRSYFETIGTEHERITSPSVADAQCYAVALLYDLSDTTRLAASKWDTYPVSDTRTGGLRILCDGTRVSGK